MGGRQASSALELEAQVEDCPKDKIIFLGKPSAIFGMTEIGLGPTVRLQRKVLRLFY